MSEQELTRAEWYLEMVKKAENLTGFVVVTKAEAAYAHVWAAGLGYVDPHDCGLWMATPGRHEVSLFECVADLQKWYISFYRPIALRCLQAGLRAYGGMDHYKRAEAACKATRRKIFALEIGFPKRARRLLARLYPEHRLAQRQLAAVQNRDYKEVLRFFSEGNQLELDEARAGWYRMIERLSGDGLPPADTTLNPNRDALILTRLDATGEEWPQEDFITQYCVPSGTRD